MPPGQKTTLICFLDKSNPPDHSFITGMLGEALPKAGGLRVELITGNSGSKSAESPQRYHLAALLPLLPPTPRKGIVRIKGAIKAYILGRRLIRKARKRGERAVLFVRNDPALLGISSLLKFHADLLIFQSSFPLEDSHSSTWKRKVHRTAYRAGALNVDAVLGVSPLGVERAKQFIPKSAHSLYIPLLSDLPVLTDSTYPPREPDIIRFLYIGTHEPRRRLDIIVKGITKALNDGVPARFDLVGGKLNEISSLRTLQDVERFESDGLLNFHEPIARGDLPLIFKGADVGLSLIPPKDEYKEASPTKLAEYMGAGLAVLGSQGIELQEQFIKQSKGGILIDFTPEAICDGIKRLSEDSTMLFECQKNAKAFAAEQLQYRKYVSELKQLIDLN